MNIVFLFLCAILFFVLSPGVLVKLPPKGSKYVVVATHALVFFLVLYFLGDTLTNTILRLFM